MTSDLALTESFESFHSDSAPNPVGGSEQAVIELVGLRQITRQSTIPVPVPIISSDTGESPVTTAEATPLALTPMEPVLFEAPPASTDSSVRKLAGQSLKSINRLTGNQTPTRSKGKAKATLKTVAKSAAKASAARTSPTPTPSPLTPTPSTTIHVPIPTIVVPAQTTTQKDMFAALIRNDVSLDRKAEEISSPSLSSRPRQIHVTLNCLPS